MAGYVFTCLSLAVFIGVYGIFDLVHAQTCDTPGFTLSTAKDWCFSYVDIYRQWPRASIICQTYDATLVTIENLAKDTQIRQFIVDMSKVNSIDLHVGGTNILAESNWIWYQRRGDEFSNYTNWDTNQPAATSGYSCLSMTAGNPDYKWTNLNCLQTRQFICQKKPNVLS